MKGPDLQLAALLSAAQDPSWVSGDSAPWTHQQWCRRSYFPLGCTSKQHLIWKEFLFPLPFLLPATTLYITYFKLCRSTDLSYCQTTNNWFWSWLLGSQFAQLDFSRSA